MELINKYLIIVFIFINISFLSAQDVDRNVGFYGTFKFQNAVHQSFLMQYRNNAQLLRYHPDPNTTGSGGLTAESGYFIIPKKKSAGYILGFTGYSTPSLESWINMLDVKYFILESRNSPFVYAQFGRISGAFDDKIIGRQGGIGIGQKFFFTKKLAGIINASYQFAAMSLNGSKLSNTDHFAKANGIEIGIGLYF